ncbi:hypothetical protein KR067_005554 [Drosophila pandora]|nr:hypothetical protein KR067_005554 [Drosophila pandora]
MSLQKAKVIDQKEYLKKYLSGDKEKKKKKKDKKLKKAAKVKIIDDDAYEDNGQEMDEDLLFGGEDAPQIVAEYIEDDPSARSKWRNIAVKDEIKEESGESPPAPAIRIKQEPLDDEEDLWGRKAATVKVKDEFSPQKRQIKQEKRSRSRDLSPDRSKKKKNHPDLSPPRRKADRDQSPRGRKRKDSDQSPPRRAKDSPQRRRQDASPVRKRRSSDQSPPRRRRDDDQSPPRRRRNDSDQSPPRKRREQSPVRRRRDSDQSPPRKRRDDDLSPPRRKSPPRRQDDDQSPPRRRRKDSDQSPPIRQSPVRRRRDSDQSPPRRRRSSSGERKPRRDQSSPPRNRFKKETERKSRWAKESPKRSLSPPPTHKPKSSKTLDGKKAGLQDAQSLKKESDERRRQEHDLFEKMSSEVSGRDAEVQMRSTGRKGRRARDAADEDPAEQRRKEEHEKKKKELYDRWGKGLKQIEDQKSRMEEMAHEASKPVARYANDEDLDRHLREQEHADDPMLEYIRSKRKKRDQQSNQPVMPKYEGSYPENRFGIRPGYRWDGVDRSNGYEKRWFDKQNEKRAVQDEAYKYSVEDM